MKRLILTLLLSLSCVASDSHAGPLAKRVMAASGQKVLKAAYFEDFSLNGWVATGNWNYTSGEPAWNFGTSIYWALSQGSGTLTGTGYTKAGNLTFRFKTPSAVLNDGYIGVKVDGVNVTNYAAVASGGDWVLATIPMTAGQHVVEILIFRPNAGTANIYVDEIVVP